MKNLFVHSLAPPRTENKRARRMKQAALVVALLLPALVAAQRFPDATDVLANVRLRHSQHASDFRGQIRRDAKSVRFHLVHNGPVGRYVVTNPDLTWQVR